MLTRNRHIENGERFGSRDSRYVRYWYWYTISIGAYISGTSIATKCKNLVANTQVMILSSCI